MEKPIVKKGYVSRARQSTEKRERRRWNPAGRAFVSMAALLFACVYIIVRVWFAMHSDSPGERPHAAHGSVVNVQLITPKPNPASTPGRSALQFVDPSSTRSTGRTSGGK